MRLPQDRRKAFQMLQSAGYSVETVRRKGEVKVTAPDGTPLGRFTVAKRNRDTPKRLVARVNAWRRGSR